MTRALVLYAHPCGNSFSAALHDVMVEALAGRGLVVDDCDLYAEGFDPVLSEAERRSYHDLPGNLKRVSGYVEWLRAADAMVLVCLIWSFGFPAILKGFLDRVFLPGVSVRLDKGSISPSLTNLRRLAAVTTYGAPRLRAILAGDPPRAPVTRILSHVCQVRTTRYLALYDMNRAPDHARQDFLRRVAREMAEL